MFGTKSSLHDKSLTTATSAVEPAATARPVAGRSGACANALRIALAALLAAALGTGALFASGCSQDALQTTADAPAASSSATVSDAASSEQDADESAQEPASSEKAVSADASAADEADGTVTRAGVAASFSSGEDFAASSSAAGESAVSDGTSSSASADAQDVLSVEVTVDSSAADGSVSFSGTVELPAGANAFDALVATGLDIQSSDSQYGAYVEAVDGLEAGAFGEMSGWLYDVNDEVAMVAADAYELVDGDSVAWTYSTGE